VALVPIPKHENISKYYYSTRILVAEGSYCTIVLGNDHVTPLVTKDSYIAKHCFPSFVTIERMSHSIFRLMTS